MAVFLDCAAAVSEVDGRRIILKFKRCPGTWIYCNYPERLPAAALGDSALGNKYLNRVFVEGEAQLFASYLNTTGSGLFFGALLHNPGNATARVIRQAVGHRHSGQYPDWCDVQGGVWGDFFNSSSAEIFAVPPGGGVWIFEGPAPKRPSAGLMSSGIAIASVTVQPSHRGGSGNRLTTLSETPLVWHPRPTTSNRYLPVDTTLTLLPVGYSHPHAADLVARVQQEYVDRYGSPDESHVDPTEFDPPEGLFLVGYADGVPIATGAWRVSEIRELGGTSGVEVKRMYVVPEARRAGYSRQVLAELERTAAAAGHDLVVLSTGPMQPEAIALYEASGYVAVPAFGHYALHDGLHAYGKRI